MNNPFVYAEGKRVEITVQQSKEIKGLYRESSREIKKDVEKFKGMRDSSSSLQRTYLNNLKNEIVRKMRTIDNSTEKIISGNVDKMVSVVLENNEMFLKNAGMSTYSMNPDIKYNMISRITTGKLYNNKWSLSSSIWGDNAAKTKEIEKIISKGILKNESTYDIAKNLERYVNPDARKNWKWSNVFPGSRRKIDYNAQRLARTMISHAYQESFVEMTINNPFITGYKWVTSGSDRVCPLCMDRESLDQFGLGPGIFPKDKLPLDHPNGMCTFECISSFSDDEISDAIADWYLGVGDKQMNKQLDKFVESFQ